MSQPLLVRRAAFVMEDPWAAPQGSERIALRRSTDGAKPRQRTTIVVYADDDCLNVLFESEDDGVVATHLRHNAPLYEEDVVEMFLAPSNPRSYFEIEVNPLATTFDAKIDSPDGIRTTMRVDLAWDCPSLFAAVRKTPGRFDTIVRVPFACLGVTRPSRGDEWRGNFFRIDRSPNRGDEYMAWQPTMKNPADFHVAAAFGRIVFA
ncbi:MAG TPA: carbohydrate-binding family 9-like protein [Thermoanaerobaculia bacterium]|nr:carbohydrate-binding family 9-like protein [Thermoanaerobaculia bacterium]